MALIGFDGIEDAEFHTPSLSTITPDKAEIARLALAFLEQRIAGGAEAGPQEGFAPFELQVRQSTDISLERRSSR